MQILNAALMEAKKAALAVRDSYQSLMLSLKDLQNIRHDSWKIYASFVSKMANAQITLGKILHCWLNTIAPSTKTSGISEFRKIEEFFETEEFQGVRCESKSSASAMSGSGAEIKGTPSPNHLLSLRKPQESNADDIEDGGKSHRDNIASGFEYDGTERKLTCSVTSECASGDNDPSALKDLKNNSPLGSPGESPRLIASTRWRMRIATEVLNFHWRFKWMQGPTCPSRSWHWHPTRGHDCHLRFTTRCVRKITYSMQVLINVLWHLPESQRTNSGVGGLF